VVGVARGAVMLGNRGTRSVSFSTMDTPATLPTPPTYQPSLPSHTVFWLYSGWSAVEDTFKKAWSRVMLVGQYSPQSGPGCHLQARARV
jgi:hypothetical protein